MKIVTISILMTLINLQYSLAGGNIVGDGGLVAICNSKNYFFDVYEYQFRNNSFKDTRYIGKAQLHKALDEISTAINRKYSLNNSQANKILSATKQIKNAHLFEQVSADFIDEIISKVITRPLVTDSDVYQSLQDDRCHLEAGAILLDYKEIDYNPLKNHCDRIGSDGQTCLLVSNTTFRILDGLNSVCFATHELLRFLPKHIFESSDIRLRSETINICYKVYSELN